MPVNKSVTYSWKEDVELDENNQPTGYIILIIPTAGDDYNVIVSADADDFSKAATVVAVQTNLGKPE